MHPLSRSTPGSSSCRAAANNTRSRTLVSLQHSRTNRFLTTLPSSLASRFPPSLTRPAMSRMGRQTIHSLETISLPSFFGMSFFFFRVSDCSTCSCQPCIWHTSSTSRLSRPEHQVYTNIQQEGSYARRLLHVSPNPRQSRRTGLHSSQFGCGCKLQPCGTIAFAFINLVEIGRGRQWL